VEALEAIADAGYFSGQEVKACEPLGVVPYVPKPQTSPAKAKGQYGKQDFVYQAKVPRDNQGESQRQSG
jgi:transposase